MEYNNNGRNDNYKKNNGRNNYNNRNNNYNRNNNNNYNRNNNNYQRNNNQYAIEYDARRNERKPDFAVADRFGKEYVINGDFAFGLVADVPHLNDKINLIMRWDEIKNSENLDEVGELLRAIREISLGFLNQNIEGKVYDLTDIKRGFPSIDDLYSLFETIAAHLPGGFIDGDNQDDNAQ